MVEKKREQITIFCDGSCWAGHPEKKGGFGTYIQTEKKDYWISRGYTQTTISRMELRAILYALKAIKIDIRTTATIYSDSQYCVDTINKKGFDWKRGDLKGVDNYDLIDRIFKEVESHKKTRIKIIWIPGHRKRYDDPIVAGNFIADYLADYKNHETYFHDILKEKPYIYNSERRYDPSQDPNFLEECEGIFID